MADLPVELYVGGQIYGGWKTMNLVRSIRALSSVFSLDITDNWTGKGPLVIKAGDACQLKIGDEAVVTGYVDEYENTIDSGSHTIHVSGRDKTADIVDCTAIVGQGEVLNQDLLAIAKAVAGPFGVEVKSEVDAGSAFSNFSIQPGETGFAVLDRAGRLRGRIFTADGKGALVLTQVGVKRARGALVEGKNAKAWSLRLDTKERFSKYVVKAQHGGTDADNGATAAHVMAEASDATMGRYRPLVIIAEDQASIADALIRAQWEAKTRAANAATVQVTVQGYEQLDGGPLWTINELVPVELPSIGIKQDLLISEVTMKLDDGGRTTQLTLVRPDAFLPEPVVQKKNEPTPSESESEL